MTSLLKNMTVWSVQPITLATQGVPLCAFTSGRAPALEASTWQLQDPDQSFHPENPFIIPPNSQRYLTGLIARVADGTPVLGVAAFLDGKHSVIASGIEEHFGQISSYLWSGELFLKNGSATPACGVMQKLNATSGFLLRAEKDGDSRVVKNRITGAKSVLLHPDTLLPFKIATDAQFIPYVRSLSHLGWNELAPSTTCADSFHLFDLRRRDTTITHSTTLEISLQRFINSPVFTLNSGRIDLSVEKQKKPHRPILSQPASAAWSRYAELLLLYAILTTDGGINITWHELSSSLIVEYDKEHENKVPGLDMDEFRLSAAREGLMIYTAHPYYTSIAPIFEASR